MLKYLSLLLLAATAALAQPPPGGYVPKQVKHLARVAEPPGGLVPYRKGALWGYADTTGNVVIAPVLNYQPAFFTFGFGQVYEEQDDERGRQVDHNSKEFRLGLHTHRRFLNARGETLKGDNTHVVILMPDSSLQLVERQKYIGQPGLLEFRRNDDGTLQVITELIDDAKVKFYMMSYLGDGRTIGYKRQNLPPKAYALAPHLLRGALVDGEQRRLTPFKYAKIYPFRDGFARFEATGAAHAQWGLLDRNGRELLHHYSSVDGPHSNRLIVYRSARDATTAFSGIVDTAGHFIARFEQRALLWLIPGQLIVHYSYNQEGNGLMSPEGKMLLDGQLFKQVTRFSTDRLLVRGFDGKTGVLSGELRWIVPFEKQELVPLMNRYERKDTTVIVVVSEGKQGLLDMRDGRVIIPAHYETISSNYYRGKFYSARRAGRQYVLNRYGQEIIAARPAEEYYEPNERLQPKTALPLLAVVQPHEDTGLIGLIDSAGRAHSNWQPYLRPGQRNAPPHVFTNGPEQPDPALAVASFTPLPRGWRVNDSLLVSPHGKTYAAPDGAKWRPRMVVGRYYEATPFEFGVYLTDKGYVTRSGVKLWEK